MKAVATKVVTEEAMVMESAVGQVVMRAGTAGLGVLGTLSVPDHGPQTALEAGKCCLDSLSAARQVAVPMEGPSGRGRCERDQQAVAGGLGRYLGRRAAGGTGRLRIREGRLRIRQPIDVT